MKQYGPVVVCVQNKIKWS